MRKRTKATGVAMAEQLEMFNGINVSRGCLRLLLESVLWIDLWGGKGSCNERI